MRQRQRSRFPIRFVCSGGLESTLLEAQRQELLRSLQACTTQSFVLSAVVSIRCSWRCSSAAIKQPASMMTRHSIGKQLLSITR
jgi:hypothetical protein